MSASECSLPSAVSQRYVVTSYGNESTPFISNYAESGTETTPGAYLRARGCVSLEQFRHEYEAAAALFASRFYPTMPTSFDAIGLIENRTTTGFDGIIFVVDTLADVQAVGCRCYVTSVAMTEQCGSCPAQLIEFQFAVLPLEQALPIFSGDTLTPAFPGSPQSVGQLAPCGPCPSAPTPAVDGPVEAPRFGLYPIAVVGRVHRPGKPDLVYRSKNQFLEDVTLNNSIDSRIEITKSTWLLEAAENVPCSHALQFNGTCTLSRVVIGFDPEPVGNGIPPIGRTMLNSLNFTWPATA